MTTARDQMVQARELIRQGRYDDARKILKKVNHPKAKEWLDQLDERELNAPLQQTFAQVAPQPINITVKEKRKAPGCLGISLGVGCGAPLFFCIGLIVIVILIAAVLQSQKEDATKKAVDVNVGQGTLENPIDAGARVQFTNAAVTVERMVRPATAMVEGFNAYNEDPAVGAEYVLLWVNLICQKDHCQPQLDFKIRLVDTAGKEWGEPFVVILDSNLDGQEALRGATLSGWQAFEYPIGEPIQVIWMNWGDETLYVRPPVAG